jgi:hypothetical protein
VIVAATLVLASNMFGQQAQAYRQAAQTWRNAAGQCQEPVASACMNQNAAYCDCLASQLGPGSGSTRCTSPSCSTTCRSGGSGGAGSTGAAYSSPDIPLANTGNAKADLALNGLGLLMKWKMAHDAKKAGEDQPHDQSSNYSSPDDSAAQLAARQAAEQQRLHNEAAQILQESNTLMASNDADAGLPLSNSSPDSTTAIGALLDSGTSSTDSTSAISALLDSTDEPNTSSVSTANTVASLLDSDSPAGQQAAVASLPEEEAQTTSPDAQALQTAMTPPPSSPLASSFSASGDDPASTQPTTLFGVMDSIKDSVTSAVGSVTTSIQDGYDSVMGDLSSFKQTASSLWKDPSVQFLNQLRQGDLTTAPATNSADTPDQAADKTFSQAVVGFGDFKGPNGKGSYDTKMINQMAGNLDMANVQIGGQSQ